MQYREEEFQLCLSLIQFRIGIFSVYNSFVRFWCKCFVVELHSSEQHFGSTP